MPATQTQTVKIKAHRIPLSGMNLGLTQERWPDIVFHETREHSVKLKNNRQ
ncbi:hypothetical protein ACVWQX_03245 [Neisseria meningitidis]